jgi:hypothetical protein
LAAEVRPLKIGKQGMETKHHSYPRILLLTIAGALITAFVFVVTIYLSLPPTDSAYHQGMANTFADPFVLTVALFWALVSGLLVSPVLYFCLRRRRLALALPIVLSSTLITVVILTPVSAIFGLLGALVVTLASSVICGFIRIQKFELI